MNKNVKRIHYYAHKVVQYSAKRRSWPHRYKRLMVYKAAMYRRIEAERMLNWPADPMAAVAVGTRIERR